MTSIKEFQSRSGKNRQQQQSGFPQHKRVFPSVTPGSINLRGVVVATYVAETVDELLPGAVYCDVLVMSNMPTVRGRVIPKALVMQPLGSGIQAGRVWKPRAATQTINGQPFTPQSVGLNPGEIDGDFVLIGFIDDMMNQPVILGALPHPSRDIGNETKRPGHRMRLILEDGDPEYIKHHGSFYGVGDDGGFEIDTTNAHNGALLPDGSEPEHTEGEGGNVQVRLPAGANVTIEVDEGNSLEIQNSEGDTLFKIGDGAKHVAVGEPLKALYEELKLWCETHTHPTGVGPSGPSPQPAPAFDESIVSSHVSLPESENA